MKQSDQVPNNAEIFCALKMSVIEILVSNSFCMRKDKDITFNEFPPSSKRFVLTLIF